MQKEEKRDLFLKEELQKCIVREPFASHSGLQLTWKCDVLLNRKYHWNFVRNLRPRYKLAGIELGGFLLAQSFDSGAILVRKNGDSFYTHGEYKDPKGNVLYDTVSIVDDVITTGESIKEAIGLFKGSPFKVGEILCVLDRREKKERKIEGITVHSLYTNEDFNLPWR